MPPGPPTFAFSRWLFLRLLAIVYLIAFVSLGVQIAGLVGERGILPLEELLPRARDVYGARAYRLLPTSAWISPSATFLEFLCWGGAAASLLLAANVAPVPVLFLLWLLYLSVTVAGQTFLQFQWDALLLETGLVAILYAPTHLAPRLRDDTEPPGMVRWVLWLLAFKLTFLSGITKLVSGDATWASWTALTYHYETQPIPAWTSWFAHQMPRWFHVGSTPVLLCIELVVPFFVLLPATFRRTRATAVALMALLQLIIGATGNYGFFNLLAIVLYVALLDDWILGRPRVHPTPHPGPFPVPGRGNVRRAVVNALAIFIGLLSLLTLIQEIEQTRRRQAFETATQVLSWIAPLRSINGYGLFRVMTTERPEIVIEVSADGREWREWEFRWKAGDVMRRPRFVQPHMPRLDWQMWFAALDPWGAQFWLERFVERLLVGSPDVVALVGPNPLGAPPRYARLALYQYHFTTAAERAETGAWWKREFVEYLTGPVEAP